MDAAAVTPGHQRVDDRAGWPDRAAPVVRLVAVLVMVAALVVVAGWYIRSGVMIRLGPESFIAVRINTAVMLLCLVGALLIGRRAVRLPLLGLAFAIAAVTILQWRVGFDAGIDQLLVDDWEAPDLLVAGRPSETTCVSVMLLAVSGLLADLGRRIPAQVIVIAPLTIGSLTLFGKLYGSEELYSIGPYSAMAPITGAAIVLLALGQALAVPRGLLQWIAFGTDSGAVLQRWLYPVALVGLPAAAWFIAKGEERGYYDAGMTTALLVISVIGGVLFIGYVAGLSALQSDQERDELLDEVQAVNAELEHRVRDRSHQLQRQRTKLALFEDRDRIARDLHDRVTQRVFAAGLQVGSLGRKMRKERGEQAPASSVAESLDVIAKELDLAIRELRSSIFELTSIADDEDLEQVVLDLASRASRILGFMPRVELGGRTAGLPADLVTHVASVIQEGLSNVAKHAQATAAEVDVEISDITVRVQVIDDGVGLPEPLPHSSGVSNLIARAKQLGGSATWTNREEGGAMLVWQIPRVLPGGITDSTQGNDTPVARSDSDQSEAASSSP